LLERNPCAIMREDHGQGSGAALDRFHLKNRRRPPHASAGEQSARATKRVMRQVLSHFRQDIQAQGFYPVIPVKRFIIGTTRSSGRWCRVVISARVSVPLVRRMAGPVPTAQ